MEACEMDLLDRAYLRRGELLRQEDVQWVRMVIEPGGVLLTIGERAGGERHERLMREPAAS